MGKISSCKTNKKKRTRGRETRRPRTHRGFTLIQLLVTISIISVLAALLLGVVGRGRSAARRIECDTHLKEIAMALDTYLQETGRYPAKLELLRTKNYLPASALRCPSDPDRNSTGYADFYVVREPRDSEGLPMLVCPFHESEGQRGAQAFKGRYTGQSSTQPATLVSAVGTTVVRPGPKQVIGVAGMKLQGGDRIITGAAGVAQVRFADNSTSTLTPNCDITILQSFIDGQVRGPLYTMIRQNVPASVGSSSDTTNNVVTYVVNHGSSFDVSTPTATAGALGTEFKLKVTGTTEADTQLTVIDSVVALTTASLTEQIENIKLGNPLGITVKPGNGDANRKKERKPRRRKGRKRD